jgi:hypothetical protein
MVKDWSAILFFFFFFLTAAREAGEEEKLRALKARALFGVYHQH